MIKKSIAINGSILNSNLVIKHEKNYHFCGKIDPKMVGFSVHMKFICKFTNFVRLYFSYFPTFCNQTNFTNFKMLFRAVVKGFVHLASIKM